MTTDEISDGVPEHILEERAPVTGDADATARMIPGRLVRGRADTEPAPIRLSHARRDRCACIACG